MTEMATYEHHFVTNEPPIFNMIEDESGDIFWGYGHRDGPEFIEEVNRWLVHACGACVPDDLFALSQPVEHLYARMDDEDGERFTLVEINGLPGCDNDVFPVTRLIQ